MKLITHDYQEFKKYSDSLAKGSSDNEADGDEEKESQPKSKAKENNKNADYNETMETCLNLLKVLYEETPEEMTNFNDLVSGIVLDLVDFFNQDISNQCTPIFPGLLKSYMSQRDKTQAKEFLERAVEKILDVMNSCPESERILNLAESLKDIILQQETLLPYVKIA
jgi:hypothetical protein